MRFQPIQAPDLTWFWRLQAEHGEILAYGEGFRDLRHCLEGISRVQKASSAPVDEPLFQQMDMGSNLSETATVILPPRKPQG